jgi:hypothetical protein
VTAVRESHVGDPPEESQPRATVIRLSEVRPEIVKWLWRGRLPRGKVVVLDGDPGVGKSTVALDIAAHLTTGGAWPDGAACPMGAVVVLSAEDGLADTIRPRLDASGAEPSLVHAITGVRMIADGEEIGERPPSLADLDIIETEILRTQAVLAIVDVLMAFLPSSVDSHRDQDVRGVLHRLTKLAERTGCCILLLRHLNKSAGGSPLYRGGGSIGIVGAARAGFVAARDPEDEHLVVLAPTKSNLSAAPASLGYRLVPHPNGVARVEWTGVVDRRADDLLRPEREAASDELADLVREYVADHGGSVAAAEARAHFEGSGYSEAALRRARGRAGVESVKAGMTNGWFWRIGSTRTAEDATKTSNTSPLGEPTSSTPSATPSTVCNVCQNPLDPALAALGDRAHPTCQP